jgi:uncharacterized protein (DUF736 family)
MIIGKFTQDGQSYKGYIASLALNVTGMTFSPVAQKQGSAPDFVVTVRGKGEAVEIGAAWKKTSKAGKAYLSAKLDGPMLPHPIHCALTRQQDGSYGLIWSRRADEQPASEEATA